jgi:hypothetical protein
MTYLPDISFCELLTDCSSLETELCDNCLSAQHDCIPNEKACSIQGSCNGIKMHSEEMQTAKDCLQLCDSTRGCRWFTFYTLVPVCVLFENCPSIDESSEDCISGERRCIDEVVSSTTEITTTTTEITSTTTEITSTTSTTTTTSTITTSTTTMEITSTTSGKPEGNCQFD